MADDSDDLDLEIKDKPSSSKSTTVILLAIIGVLLVVVAIGGTLLVLGGGSKSETVTVAADGETIEGSEEKSMAIYHNIRPPFVVNFHSKGRIRYVQITVELMARNDDTIDAAIANMPLIKNNLVTLFSGADFESLKTYEGKEKLREAALEEVQRIMVQETGEPGVESVLFTGFVIQ